MRYSLNMQQAILNKQANRMESGGGGAVCLGICLKECVGSRECQQIAEREGTQSKGKKAGRSLEQRKQSSTG